MPLTEQQNDLVAFITESAPCASVHFTHENFIWSGKVQSGDTIEIRTEFAENGTSSFTVLVINDDGDIEVEQPVNSKDELELASFQLQRYFSEVFLGSTVYRIIRSFTKTLQTALTLQQHQEAA